MSATHPAPRASDRLAGGLSRRATLRIVGGGFAAAVAARRFRPATAAPAHAPAHAPARSEAALAPALVGAWVIEFRPSIAAEAVTTRLVTTFAVDGAVREALAPDWASEERRHGGVGQGLWTPLADGSAISRSITLRYDGDGWYQGESILSASFALDATADTLAGEFVRRYLDADGTPIAFEAGTIHGVRVASVEPDVDVLAPTDLPPQPGRPGEPY